MEHHISIAIDGPAGAGKSTLAKAAAAELGFVYVDTGAIYRTIGYWVFQSGGDPRDAKTVEALLAGLEIALYYGDDGLQHMRLNGADVTEEIRLPDVSRFASAVSAHGAVRNFLLEMQRDLARHNHVIMDGRDIGTVVLPDADVKIFLTASPEARAGRRALELTQRGTPEPVEQVLADIQERDWADTHRKTAPLRPAEDAVTLDTTALSFEESLSALLTLIRGRAAL